MKTNQIIRAFGFGLVVIMTILCPGCSTEYKGYSGPTLPSDQTATLKVPWRNGALGFEATTYFWMSAIDGKKRYGLGGSDTVIKLLPGKHTISFMFIKAGAGYSDSPSVKDINVEAGKTYLAILHEHLAQSSQINANVQPVYSGSQLVGATTTLTRKMDDSPEWSVEITPEK